jgi:hypothetical protein
MMNEDQADMRDKLNQRRAMMHEDLADKLYVPTKKEWVKWVMANRREVETKEKQMKTSELTGTDLNKAVAECLGIKHTRFQGQVIDQFCNPLMYDDDWSLAGPIIEREKIQIKENGHGHWFAKIGKGKWLRGPTPLIAAMRCFVATKQGEQ